MEHPEASKARLQGIHGLICRDELATVKGLNIEFKTTKGRFREEENVEVYLVHGDLRERLLVIKVFHGRPPFYRKWVELFHVKTGFTLGGNYVEFAGSELEEKLVECLSRFLQGGEWLYIEYAYDSETRTALERGVPPVLTRLGYLLLQHGFTWFKDWYYPEGFMEGNPKLQAEKPASEDIKRKHYTRLCLEVGENLGKLGKLAEIPMYSWIANRALERARVLVEECRVYKQ